MIGHRPDIDALINALEDRAKLAEKQIRPLFGDVMINAVFEKEADTWREAIDLVKDWRQL